MSLDWLTFKSKLGNLDNVSIAYVDSEGSEIPIESEIEFQEAIRLAKLNGKNHIQIILTLDKLKTEKLSEKMKANSLEKKRKKANVCYLNLKESSCQCKGDVPPEWFTHYMMKFKKGLMEELKSSIHETIHNAFDQRETKLMNKTQKLPFHKIERTGSRSRPLEMTPLKAVDKTLPAFLCKPSAFLKDKIKIMPDPDGKFCVSVPLVNNDAVAWTGSVTKIECFSIEGVTLEETSFAVPEMFPGDEASIRLDGRVTHSVGPHHFKCRLLRHGVEVGQPVLCWAEVQLPSDTAQVFASIIQNKNENPVEELIDFEHDVLVSSQRKIEENISEIEKRLQDIDLLRPSSSCESNGKKNNDKTSGFQTSCDLLQSLDNRGESLGKREDKELRLVGGSSFIESPQTEERNMSKQEEGCSDPCCKSYLKTQSGGIQDDSESEKVESFKKKKDGELYSDSDSEPVIFLSEEEDNFIIVPLVLESSSPEPAESIEEKFENIESPSCPTGITNEASQSVKVEDNTVKIPEPEIMHETSKKEEVGNAAAHSEDCSSSQSNSTRSRRSPFGEESAEFKTKKIKSSRPTEYQFTAANLTQPTFYPHPEKREEREPFTFTFTAESPKKKERKSKRKVPITDSSGRVIFAVKTNGCCLPVETILKAEAEGPKQRWNFESGNRSPGNKQNERRPGREEKASQHRFEKHSERFQNEGPAVNILPNVLVNGASNMASLAISTAKSVINNLQSAFVTEGKTEMGKPAYEQKQISREALFKLYEMGFGDLQVNQKLLLLYDNDLAKVVEELIRSHEKQFRKEE